MTQELRGERLERAQALLKEDDRKKAQQLAIRKRIEKHERRVKRVESLRQALAVELESIQTNCGHPSSSCDPDGGPVICHDCGAKVGYELPDY